MGDCTPTVGFAHPRLPGPCAKAMGTSDNNWAFYSGGNLVPVLGSADDIWVTIVFLNRTLDHNQLVLVRVMCATSAKLHFLAFLSVQPMVKGL